MKIAIVMLMVGLGAGFAAGYWLAPDGDETGSGAGDVPVEPKRVRVVSTAGGGGEAAGPVRMARRIRVPVKREFADLAACRREVERLAGTVQELAREVSVHEKDMEFEVGKPIPFPGKLDPKYLEPDLMRNLNQAFDEVGLDGDVSFVDCDEFPCIVCAGLGAGQGEEMAMDKTMEKLRAMNESEAMSTYENSQRQNSVMVRREANDGGISNTLNNCQAIYPPIDDTLLRQQLEKRLRWRMNKLNESM